MTEPTPRPTSVRQRAGDPPSSYAGGGNLGPAASYPPARPAATDLGRPAARDSLVDVLERVLDKGVVIAGDISISLLDIELLTIKLRLLIASVDKAKEMGIDWWTRDPQLSGSKGSGPAKSASATPNGDVRLHSPNDENQQLREQIRQLEAKVNALTAGDDGASLTPRRQTSAAKSKGRGRGA